MPFASPGPAGVLAPEWTMITIAACILIALLHLRLNIQKRRLLISDILMCITWCMAVLTSSFDIKFALMGALDPPVLYDLTGFERSVEETKYFIKLAWSSTIPFTITIWFCKASLLAVYFQVFPSFMVKRRMLLWATLVYIIASCIISVLLSICICLPIERNWSLNPDDMCIVNGGLKVLQVTWALHIIGDLVVFILPWLILPDLQLTGALRMGVYYTFLLGLIDIAVCLTRFVIIQAASVETRPSMSLLTLLGALDYTISLVIACLPSLRPYLRTRRESSYAKSMNTESSTKRSTGVGSTSLAETEV